MMLSVRNGLLLFVLFWVLVLSGYYAYQKHRFDTMWQPTTVPYEVSCEEGCRYLDAVTFGPQAEGVLLGFRPDTDDAVAQWGDCLQSVLSCVEGDQGFSDCVAQSFCPEFCKEAFLAGKSQDRAHFEAVFIEQGGVCVPDEGTS